MQATSNTSSELQFIRRAFIVIALAALVATIWALADILLLLFGAVLVAVLLRAIADPFARYLRLSEGPALTLAGLLIVAVLACGILMLGITPQAIRPFPPPLSGVSL